MPNTPARVTLGISATAGNILGFGADNGLLAPDQIAASAASDGPVAFYTLPNHMSTNTSAGALWWRTWSPLGSGISYPAYFNVVQPLLVTKKAYLQALAAYTPSSGSGWANPIIVSLYEWTGVGLQFTRRDTAYIPPQTGAAGTQAGYTNTYPLLTPGHPYVLIASSISTWYCYSKRNLPGLFPAKATAAATPADVTTYPGMSATISNTTPDSANMAALDLETSVPGSWVQTNQVPFFICRLGAA